MISLCAGVYEHLLQLVFEEQKDHKEQGATQSSMIQTDDTEDVYYRFGGATLASMLHLRYDDLKSAPPTKKDSIMEEIKVLKNIQCPDKSHVPDYLQYRDNGYMYFPKKCFIPFIRAVDKCVCNFANEQELKKNMVSSLLK